MTNWLRVALVGLGLLMGVGAISSDDQYIITIDAGSSGSRVHVHQVSAPTADNPIPVIKSAVNKKIKPGLSSFKNNPGDAKDHVNGLVDFALDNVPPEVWKDTPIYLKATAGMRSIPQDAADKIIAVCRGTFAATTFRFEPHWASVIPGTDEGKFSWIAANYLKGRFTTKKDLPLVGTIEMGGASLQISYPLKTAEDHGEDYIRIDLDQSYHLYAHSFLGYGLDKAQELLAEKGENVISSCYPKGLTLDDVINVSGSGDYDQCSSGMDFLMGKSQCPVAPPVDQTCSLNGYMVPKFDGIHFLAIENFFYTAEFFQTETKPDNLPEKGREFCGRSWLENKEKSPNEDEDQLKRYCFSSAFIPTVLEKGLGIRESQVEIAHNIEGTDIDWAIGSVIHDVVNLEGGFAHGKKRESKKNRAPFVRFFMVLAPLSVFLLAVVFILDRVRKKKYQRISQKDSLDGSKYDNNKSKGPR